ncbi:hypothetical protein GOBAR_AA29509 [Gossypium barbadense]|uniref:Uncharacterized protein n=1 Tax=Gossypium barbadense TaxID=3634 RepID=A0A2P5WJB7_GOSBA|nr:hypothetical protein GOBAR_AA29509 [Gossypium barbadense]
MKQTVLPKNGSRGGRRMNLVLWPALEKGCPKVVHRPVMKSIIVRGAKMEGVGTPPFQWPTPSPYVAGIFRGDGINRQGKNEPVLFPFCWTIGHHQKRGMGLGRTVWGLGVA